MSDPFNPNNIPEALRATVAQSLTAPLPIEEAKKTKYYYCTLANTSMHRKDGAKLAFVFNILKTNMFHDQEYLDDEIERNHPHLRYATDDEIRAFNMRINPRETIKQELMNDPVVRQELEDKIRAEMLGLQPSEVDHGEDTTTDEKRVQGTESQLSKLREGTRSGTGTILPATAIPQQTPAPAPAPRLTPVSTEDIKAGAKDSGK